MNRNGILKGSPHQKSHFISETLRKLIRKDAPQHILKVVGKSRPEDIAQALNYLSTFERRYFFNTLSGKSNLMADIISFTDHHVLSEILEKLDKNRICEILKILPSDDAADIIALLPERLGKEVLSTMRKDKLEELENILRYPEDSAGGIMDTNFLSLNIETTVGEAIEEVRRASENIHVFYLYVVNENSQLVGVLSLRKLIMVSPQKKLNEIMNREVISVRPEEDQEVVANIVERYDLMAIPVVDEFNKLIGIITVDDVIDVIKEEATEDILRIAGTDERNITEKASFKQSMNRVVWMGIYLLSGIIVSELIFRFDDSLKNSILWAGFIPVIMSLGGGMGNQSSILLMRGTEIFGSSIPLSLRLIFKEVRFGLLIGLVYAIIIFLFILLRHPEVYLFGMAVSVSIILSIITGAFLGSFIPLLLKRLQLDPTIAIGPFLSALLDITVIAIYLLLLSLIQ